ncbi:MAG: hypothetical protein J6W21_02640, partial [Bacteroidaceae bacterium]|nr:hypothetical protein [Bacteroidaceae bacterium]
KNYQGDELNIRGNVDVTFRLPPVPARGVYELRFNIQSDGYNRGMVQFYWGHDRDRLAAMGIPMDVRMSGLERRTTAGTFPSGVGWEPDIDDDDTNAEVDKKMRNKGFMKGAEIYCDGAQGVSVMARADPLIIRRVILREQMDPDKNTTCASRRCSTIQHASSMWIIWSTVPRKCMITLKDWRTSGKSEE